MPSPPLPQLCELSRLPVVHHVICPIRQAEKVPAGQGILWVILQRPDVMNRCSPYPSTLPKRFLAEIPVTSQNLFALRSPLLGPIELLTCHSPILQRLLCRNPLFSYGQKIHKPHWRASAIHAALVRFFLNFPSSAHTDTVKSVIATTETNIHINLSLPLKRAARLWTAPPKTYRITSQGGMCYANQ